MKTKILRYIFVSVAVLVASTQPLAAGTSNGLLNFGKMPLVPPQTAQPLNAPPDDGYANQNAAEGTKKVIETAAVAKAATGREARNHARVDSPSPKAIGTFITFDVPGAVNGTYPAGINPPGAIAGYYGDENFVGHGFVRNHNGTLITFDVPNDTFGTYPSGINPAGATTGTYCDEVTCHAFLRNPNGTFTTFDAPGAFFISSVTINPAGVIIGTFFDANFVPHGFVRAKDGTVTTIDVPGAVNGTQAVAINPEGVITGTYTDASFVNHGYLRASDGNLTTFDPPAPGFIEPSPHSRSDPTYPSCRRG